MSTAASANKAILALLLLAALPAQASPVVPADNLAGRCADVTASGGAVQILDESRTQITEITPYEVSSVSCGGWISIDRGWAALRHRGGALIHIGPQSFVQLQEGSVVLFRGEAYAEGKDLRLATPNSTLRIVNGAALLLFQTDAERSEAVALQGNSILENRFVGSHPQTLHAGELSQVDFQLTRVVPAAPQPVELKSLEAKLAELHVAPKARAAAVRFAKARAKAAKKLIQIAAQPTPGRSPAGLVSDIAPPRRHEMPAPEPRPVEAPPPAKRVAAARKPKVNHKSAPAVPVVETEPADVAEKRRLIDELSAIKVE